MGVPGYYVLKEGGIGGLGKNDNGSSSTTSSALPSYLSESTVNKLKSTYGEGQFYERSDGTLGYIGSSGKTTQILSGGEPVSYAEAAKYWGE